MEYSKFNEDIRKEQLFGEWLDIHLYMKLKNQFKSITRNTDINLQKMGVDVTIEINEFEKMYIDEKATLHYINKNIPTFAFEIRNDTSGAKGWLYNRNYLTNYYLLAWPNAKNVQIKSSEDFSAAEILLIAREKVIQLLEDNGLTEQSISRLVNEYRGQVSKGNNKFILANGISLNFNLFLREKPINVVISKDLLKRYAAYYTRIR